MDTMYIFPHNGDQSLSIARILRRYYPNARIIGVASTSQGWGSSRSPYTAIHQAPTLERNGSTLVPTGAQATKAMLEKGDVRIGSVTLRKEALRVYDKTWLLAQASDANVPTPTTWESLNEITAYPVFYKQRYERGGGARGVAWSKADLPVSIQLELIFQELIEGLGTYGVSFLADNGQMLASHTHFERESFPQDGGSAVIIENFQDKRLVEYTQQIIETLDYSGWGLAEFKYCPRRNDYVFMEINAKFWASCEFSFVNEPLFLQLLFGIVSKEKPTQRMVFISRAFARGIPFVISHMGYFVNSAWCLYPGDLYKITASLVPAQTRQLLRKAHRKTKALKLS